MCLHKDGERNLTLCNVQCYCDMLGHDLVPKDTPAHIFQTQSAAYIMPQHCKFLVLFLEKWRRLRFMVIVKTISCRWSMKGTEKVLFFSILGRLYCVCLPNWRETHLQFCVLKMLSKWGGLTSGQRILWQKTSEMKTFTGLCSRGSMQKAVTD